MKCEVERKDEVWQFLTGKMQFRIQKAVKRILYNLCGYVKITIKKSRIKIPNQAQLLD